MYTRTPSPRTHAFTLIEIMVAMTILLIVMTLVFQFFLSSLDIYGVSAGKLNVNGDLRQFTELITRDCAKAQTITIIDGGNGVQLQTRNNATTTYTRTTAGELQRLDSTSGQTRVLSRNLLRTETAVPIFASINIGSSLLIRGRLSSPSRSRQQSTVQANFEYVVTRRG